MSFTHRAKNVGICDFLSDYMIVAAFVLTFHVKSTVGSLWINLAVTRAFFPPQIAFLQDIKIKMNHLEYKSSTYLLSALLFSGFACCTNSASYIMIIAFSTFP